MRKSPSDRLLSVLGDELTKPRETEHLTLRVVGLYQPIAVEEDTLASFRDGLLLLIAHPRHEAQGHPPCPQLLGVTVTGVGRAGRGLR